jgi:hypothetical protein
MYELQMKGLLLVGFAALTAGILAAANEAPTGYELSIYAATPLQFWIGVGVAMTVALSVAFTASRSVHRSLALVLGGGSTVTIFGLPLVRGYFFYGSNDPLTHLGWVRDVSTGVSDPETLFYPGIHTFAIAVQRLTALSLERSLLFVVLSIAVIFLVFVPLAVRAVTDSYDAVALAAFSSFLMLPVTNLSTHIHAHPFTQATLFTAPMLFLLFAYETRAGSSSLFSVTPVGILLVILSFALILFHPQQAANVLLVFGLISGMQFLSNRIDFDMLAPIRGQRRLYVPTLSFAVLFLLWTSRYDLFFSATTYVSDTIVKIVTGAPLTAGASVQSQGESLSSIGSGFHEIFLKMFLPTVVYLLLAGGVILAALSTRRDDDLAERNAIITYLTFGLVPPAALFLVYFLGSISEQYFRHWGFMMVLVTILGSLGLYRLLGGLSGRYSKQTIRTATAALFIVLLPIALLTVFPSPFIHMPSQHVTETQMDGYETAFTHHNDSLQLAGIRGGPERYSHGIRGVEDTVKGAYVRGVSSENVSRLTQTERAPRYLVFSENDIQREVIAYQELRYSQSDFRTIRSQPGINRVSSNGEVELYYVEDRGGG